MKKEMYPLPDQIKRADGTSRFAFVTLLMLNDSYLPGTLVMAYGLRKQQTRADLVCLVTEGVSRQARGALGQLFDRVIEVDRIFVPHKRRQERQDRPFVFNKLHVLRLGADGDLGVRYEKVVFLDADILPLERYDHLFTLDTPAGILNESRDHVMEYDQDGRYVIPRSVWEDGTWKWHRIYKEICPHGHPIPAPITDRVKTDAENMGINSSLFVLTPSMVEFNAILADLARPETQDLIGDRFSWPEMQYLTMRWSGRWTNVDLRFSSFSGYPHISVLFGTHYAGIKPWYFKKPKAMARWGRYDDFQRWFREYIEMVTVAHPELLQVKRLARLEKHIRDLDRLLRRKGQRDA